MSKNDYYEHEMDFQGQGVLSTTAADNGPLLVKDTSAAGSPTYVYVDGSANGEVAVDMDSTSEVQNVCLYQNDILQYDIDKIRSVFFRVKMNQASLDSASQFAFGLTGDRNDAIDSIAQAVLFRVVGADSGTAVVVETDDGTNDNNDIVTGQTLADSYVDFLIDFSQGTSDVRFFIAGQPVALTQTFNMSNYTGSLQLFMQIQKTADTNTDGFTVDLIRVNGIRS